jgi:hypothetical protein
MLPDGILLLRHTFLQPPDPLGQGLQLLQHNNSNQYRLHAAACT